MEKEIKRRPSLSEPRVKPFQFSEMDEETQNLHFSLGAELLKQHFGVSAPVDFYKIDVSQLEDEKLEILLGMNLNVGKTVEKYIDLIPGVLPYFQREPFIPSIPPRERELAIIRTGWLCQAEYECIHHIGAGLVLGLITTEEIIRIFKGPKAPGWNAFDSAILRATDELHNDFFISDATWEVLSEQYDEHQRLEFILLVGQYTQIAMFLNSAGVQVAFKHSGFGELSEKINRDKRAQASYAVDKEIAMIYRERITSDEFENTKSMLDRLLLKEEFEINLKMLGLSKA